MAEGGGLLNRYTVNPVSWVRIPSPPPPKYLIAQVFLVSTPRDSKLPAICGARRAPVFRAHARERKAAA